METDTPVISVENATRLRQLARWGEGKTNATAISPDGKLLAVGTTVGILLYDYQTFTRLGVVETGAEVTRVAVHPNGITVAAAGKLSVSEAEVGLWDVSAFLDADRGEEPNARVASGQELRIPATRLKRVEALAFSPDGATLALGCNTSCIWLWDVSDIRAAGAQAPRVLGWSDWVRCLAFSPDGAMLAAGSAGEVVTLWDVARGEQLHSFIERTKRGEPKRWIYSLAFSPDGSILAAGSFKHIKLWDVAGRQELPRIEALDQVRSLAFCPDGRTLASGCVDGTVTLWDVATWQELRRLEETSVAHSVVFSPDGMTLGTESWGKGTDRQSFRKWDVASGRELGALTWDQWEKVPSVAFGPPLPEGGTSGTLWAMLERRPSDKLGRMRYNVRALYVWDIATGRELRAITEDPPGSSLLFSPDRTLLLAGAALLDVATWERLRFLGGGRCRAFSPDGTLLATGGCARIEEVGGFEVPTCVEGYVSLWDVASGQQLHHIEAHGAEVYLVAVSPDGRFVASWGGRELKVWEVASGREVRTLSLPRDGPREALARARLWKAIASGETPPPPVSWGAAHEAVYNADGTMRAYLRSDGKTIRLRDITAGHRLDAPQIILEGHTGTVGAMAFSPNGAFLASWAEGEMKLWDVATGRELDTLPSSPGDTGGELPELGKAELWKILASGEEVPPVGLSWLRSPPEYSLDGRIGAGGSASGGTVWLRDLASGEIFHTLQGHAKRVTCVAFSPDGHWLATGGDDGSVRLWGVPE